MYDFNVGSTVGKWTCYIPPLHRPNLELHLFRKQHPGNIHYDLEKGIQRVPTMEVCKFTLQEAPEGDYAPDAPALESSTHFEDTNEVMQFLQAVVNEAAKWGIYPSGTKDMTKEMTAVRAHLEDMRKLVFKTT